MPFYGHSGCPVHFIVAVFDSPTANKAVRPRGVVNCLVVNSLCTCMANYAYFTLSPYYIVGHLFVCTEEKDLSWIFEGGNVLGVS